MKSEFRHNRILTIILILLYLLLPTANLVESLATEATAYSTESSVTTTAATEPCDDCPCADGHQTGDCCDTTFCSCACHAPIGSGLQLKYAPLVAKLGFYERSWRLPQVYSSIFVPPQNFA